MASLKSPKQSELPKTIGSPKQSELPNILSPRRSSVNSVNSSPSDLLSPKAMSSPRRLSESTVLSPRLSLQQSQQLQQSPQQSPRKLLVSPVSPTLPVSPTSPTSQTTSAKPTDIDNIQNQIFNTYPNMLEVILDATLVDEIEKQVKQRAMNDKKMSDCFFPFRVLFNNAQLVDHDGSKCYKVLIAHKSSEDAQKTLDSTFHPEEFEYAYLPAVKTFKDMPNPNYTPLEDDD